jgi:hypothetical protein
MNSRTHRYERINLPNHEVKRARNTISRNTSREALLIALRAQLNADFPGASGRNSMAQ